MIDPMKAAALVQRIEMCREVKPTPDAGLQVGPAQAAFDITYPDGNPFFVSGFHSIRINGAWYLPADPANRENCNAMWARASSPGEGKPK